VVIAKNVVADESEIISNYYFVQDLLFRLMARLLLVISEFMDRTVGSEKTRRAGKPSFLEQLVKVP
jgi:hypothetical protein